MKRAFKSLNEKLQSKRRNTLTKESKELKDRLKRIDKELELLPELEDGVVETLRLGEGYWAGLPASQIPDELKGQEWLDKIECTFKHKVRVTFTGYKFSEVNFIDVEDLMDYIDDRWLIGESVPEGKVILYGDWKKAITDEIMKINNLSAERGFDIYSGDIPYADVPFSIPVVCMKVKN